MSSVGQRYAVGIGTGAASGAAAGSSFGPWGALIGGAIGAGGGAVSAGLAGAEEDRQHALLEQDEKRKRKAIQLSILRDFAAEGGFPTTDLDAKMAINGLDYENAARERQFTAEHRIDPMSFVGIAEQGTKAAGNLYAKDQADALEEQKKKLLNLQLGRYQQPTQSAVTFPAAAASPDYSQSFQLSRPSYLDEGY